MVKLPQIDSLNVGGRRVFVRADLDVAGSDDGRLKTLIATVNKILAAGVREIYLAGHIGRVENGKFTSTKSIVKRLERVLEKEVHFWPEVSGKDGSIYLLENLRSDPREEKNDPEFAKELSEYADYYVNEAFAVSHRRHASIVGLPALLPHAAGIHFCQEIARLDKVLSNPARPVVYIISGAKEDKLKYLKSFAKKADKVLIAGRLPLIYPGGTFGDKVQVAQLSADKEDITPDSIKEFESEIMQAKTIVVSGPVGKYEDGVHKEGTEKVFAAVARARAFKVAGGGNTEAALNMLGLTDYFSWVSVGGGAMLEYLAKGTLPGIKALV